MLFLFSYFSKDCKKLQNWENSHSSFFFFFFLFNYCHILHYSKKMLLIVVRCPEAILQFKPKSLKEDPQYSRNLILGFIEVVTYFWGSNFTF